MSTGPIFEDVVRKALRHATLDVDAPRDAADLVRTRVRLLRRQRQRWTAAVAAALVLVVASSALALDARGGRGTDVTTVAAAPTPPPTAATVTPHGWVVAGYGTTGRLPTSAYLGWLPPSVDWNTDDIGPGVAHARASLAALANADAVPRYPTGGPTVDVFGAPDGHSGVVLGSLNSSPPNLSSDHSSDLRRLTVHGSPARVTATASVHGHPAVLIRVSDPALLYLAWVIQPDLTVVVGVTTPTFDEATLRRIADGIITDAQAPPATGSAGNGPARAAVLAAFTTAYSLDGARAADAVDGGQSLRATLARLARTRPDLVGTLSFRAGINSDAVVFTTSTRAKVNGRLTSSRPGVAPVYVNSSAVWTPTGWKVNRTGFCVALKRLGAGCT
ncbi:MAG: hypothetical protein ACQSGP_29450 [Frankia sp.]